MSRLPRITADGRGGLLARLVFLGLALAGATIATALLARLLFDEFLTGPQVGGPIRLLAVSTGLVLSGLAIAWLRGAERVWAEDLGQRYVHALRVRLFAHLAALPVRTVQTRSRGGLMLRFVGDLSALRQWATLGLARLAVAGLTVPLTLGALALVNWGMALVATLALAGGAALSIALGPALRSRAREARRHRARLTTHVNETLSAPAVMLAFGQARRESRRLRRQSERLAGAMVERARVIGRLRTVAEGGTALASAGVLSVGAWQAFAGAGQAGDVVAALSVLGLLLPAVRDLSRVNEYWQSAVVAREKLDEILDLPVQPQATLPAADLPAGPGRVAFEDVHVAGSLQGLSAVAEPGRVVAITGPNGAGKTTVLALVARLVEPDAGRVRLDGVDIATVDPGALRRALGLVGPDLPLLRGTVADNLLYRCPDAGAEERAGVEALCRIDALLAELPEGRATRLREGGANLSFGQRQRIALARGLLGRPRVLLLDEVDAHLDPQAIAVLRRVLGARRATVLMVTHRVETARMADEIWHLDGGRLLAVGPAEALIRGDGPVGHHFRNRPLRSIA